MSDKEVHAWARVRVELDVSVGPYGTGWTLEEIMKQARREAPEAVEHMIAEQKRTGSIRIVGQPTVEVVVTQEERR